jgi:hypothetical protein
MISKINLPIMEAIVAHFQDIPNINLFNLVSEKVPSLFPKIKYFTHSLKIFDQLNNK